MLKDVLIDITENFHDLGHNGSEVDAMMDSVSGMGHRIKYGHDLEGAIEAYHIDGIEGIGLWFDHMMKDFTSPQGIPLPFSEAIYEATGMEMDTAIDWLTVNAADAIELGGQAAVMPFLKKNKKAYKGAVATGMALGFVDDNPLLIAYNTFLCLNMYKKSGKQLPILDHSLHFLQKGMAITSKVCVGAAVIDIGIAVVGINLAEVIEGTEALFDNVDVIVEGASVTADIVDGAAILGVGILLSKGVKKAAKAINQDKKEQYEKNAPKAHALTSLSKVLKIGAPGGMVIVLVDYLNVDVWDDQDLLEE
ncbi:hypothetical protein [Virgibacillus sp. DJP39]|uniref:hypothetical protein n=1 Tax=Virgibacillus sp. DJP39 TaxID=3409790 RepID=UPI003BB51D80